MKNMNLRFISGLALLILFAITGLAQAQQTEIQYYRQPGLQGLNVFEPSKVAGADYNGLAVRVGGDFALQFQSVDQENAAGNTVELGSNFNLPTANLNLDVQLEDGLRMHLRTYLSARHHQEAWVKGGYIQMDKLDFIKEGFFAGLMENARIRIGMDEFNYGDTHFRRSDNASAIYNPFVGNYLMDSFSTEVFGEFSYFKDGFIGVVGVTNGKLNQSVKVNDNTDNKMSIFGKVGFDKQLQEDLRVRLTASFYSNQGTSTGGYLYGGDRGGSRYYAIMETVDGDYSDFDGRYNPRFKKLVAYQLNPFVKYQNLEFFGVYEVAKDNDAEGSFTQIGAELIYRFDKFFFGGRYNTVAGEAQKNIADSEIKRINIGGGWFLTNNVLVKLEYVNQEYSGDGWASSRFEDGKFDGINFEAVISF